MPEIQLTQGKTSQVSELDFDFVQQWKWCAAKSRNRFYAVRANRVGDNWRKFYLHRVIAERMGMEVHHHEIDHVNDNTLDNRRENLRAATEAQNQQNRGRQVNNRSGYKGVMKLRGFKWAAKITVNRKVIRLGSFDSAVADAHAYDNAARKYHGEFAQTNF